MMLTKPPADQKGKDMLMIFHHFLSFGRLMNAVTFITAAFVCPCKPLIWFFLLFGLGYTCLALYEVKAGPRADRFSVTPKFLNAMIALFGIMYTATSNTSASTSTSTTAGSPPSPHPPQVRRVPPRDPHPVRRV